MTLPVVRADNVAGVNESRHEPAEFGPVDRAGNPLCVLTVHAHPDDEASKGSATIARYHDEGVRGVLVCCTGGEAGDILNPAMDTPEVRERLCEVRMEELDASAAAIGYEAVHLLGYHDSGMPDTETNERADNFANAPLDEAVGRLVRIIRERAAAGHRHVRRRPQLLPAPRPHPRARDLGAGVRGGG